MAGTGLYMEFDLEDRWRRQSPISRLNTHYRGRPNTQEKLECIDICVEDIYACQLWRQQ